MANANETNLSFEHFLHGIEIQRIELIRGDDATQHFENDIARRVV